VLFRSQKKSKVVEKEISSFNFKVSNVNKMLNDKLTWLNTDLVGQIREVQDQLASTSTAGPSTTATALQLNHECMLSKSMESKKTMVRN
jgi:hypothetical protein